MIPINRMFRSRGRLAVACINEKLEGFESFAVLIGGSDEFSAFNNCEVYYPIKDTYYQFPSLNIARENASVCVMNNHCKSGDYYIYIFGGFDKKSID